MKKITTFITLFFVSSCGLNQPLSYEQSLNKAYLACQKRLEAKEFSKTSEMQEKCQKPETITLYKQYFGETNLDLITSIEDKNIELTKKLENGKLSQQELDKELEKFSKTKFDIAKKREEARLKAEKIKWEKEEAERAKEYKRQEQARLKEEARLAKYYRDHPEVLIAQQQLELQRQQVEAMQQQNAIAAQQMQSNYFLQQQQINMQQQQFQQQQFNNILSRPVMQIHQPQRLRTSCQSYVIGNYLNTDCN